MADPSDTPRARTAEELRDDFMDACRNLADYWAGDAVAGQSCRERIQGALHSWLCILDGVSGDMPGFDLVAQPHPADKEFHISEGEDWTEPGTVISDTMLHEILFHRGAWRDQ